MTNQAKTSYIFAAGQGSNPDEQPFTEFLSMKSDQTPRYFKIKDKDKDLRVSHYGETWPMADLCAAPAKAVEQTGGAKEMLCAALSILSLSPAVKRMIREAAEQGWRISLSRLDAHDFHLDIPERLIVLGNNGFEPGPLARSVYFHNTLLLSLVRALRDAWQEKRHGGFDENYNAESVLFLERVRAADCSVISLLAAWELRGQGEDGLWRHILGSEEGDMAQILFNTLEKDPSAQYTGKALSAAFHQWFRVHARVNACDHETLEYMDDVLGANPGPQAFGKKRVERICVETLSCLPDKSAYLRGQGEDILGNPLFAGLHEPINQSHFMHILRDSQIVYVQNVPFRDAKLAAKIFPGGLMTPERVDVAQKS
jgi:hypothetical protein